MLAVGIGAFGAHLLKPVISEDYMKVYETGVQYHLVHALGVISSHWLWANGAKVPDYVGRVDC